MSKKFPFYFAGATLLIVLAFVEGFGCSCVPHEGEPLAKQVRNAKMHADAVFEGEVLASSKNLEEENVSVEIRVITVWKGNLTTKVTILTGLHDGNCGYRFQVGEKYLVYAFNSTMYSYASTLSTHICLRTALFSKGQSDIPFLGAQKKTPRNKS